MTGSPTAPDGAPPDAGTRSRRQHLWRGLAGACHPVPGLAVTLVSVILAVGTGLDVAKVGLLGAAVLTGQLSIGWSNDWIDATRDRAVGRPDKPVAAGTVPPVVIAGAASVSLMAAIVLSALLGPAAAVALLIVVVAGWAYNLGLKATIWSGATYLLAFGALPVAPYVALPGQPWPPWWIPITGALIGFGAHFANVLPDLRADAETGVRGLPHRFGPRNGVIVMATALATASVILGVAPATTSTVFALTVSGVGIALAAATAVAAVRAPLSPVAFRLTIVSAILDVTLLIVITA
ncbi:UbiA family prenyltransferase [Amycolatopsis sp. QT-25]|uniref:UbiA family prenyltransferase n=1 Tax=Amycolatopsis sp. QT-25 TaxID=3034022 RepID=UPI0023EB422C|nr:UbiA family prenyltransferase [Amycolatopsis sp. QT-25]WET76439.1 UbiA family prenyltransferase [Amycolatopsis sp. QT-25]